MYLFAATWILFIFGILAIVFFARGYPVVHTVYSALIALLFSVYLIYDTQQIMGGKKYEISPEEHIYASVQLYIDVVYIFLAILSLGRKWEFSWIQKPLMTRVHNPDETFKLWVLVREEVLLFFIYLFFARSVFTYQLEIHIRTF